MAWSPRTISKEVHEKIVTTRPEDLSKMPLVSPQQKTYDTVSLEFYTCRANIVQTLCAVSQVRFGE